MRNRSCESMELRKKEKYYAKVGDYDALKHIKKEIKKAVPLGRFRTLSISRRGRQR